MSIAAGLVGLPNVGKSTLFNALTASTVPAENYPFCTIEPHVATTTVPDDRITRLQKIYGSTKLVPAYVRFVDIAGLVKGAASGQGLGNQFLSHIKEVDLIVHVLRCFEDAHITAEHSTVDPIRDFDIIVTELMLKDLEAINKRKIKVATLLKAAQAKPAEKALLTDELELLNTLETALNNQDFKQVQTLCKNPLAKNCFLLSGKPWMIVANVSETECTDELAQMNKHVQALNNKFGKELVAPVSVRLESELSKATPKEAEELASMLGATMHGLDMVIQKAYAHLGLITFFTCGPQEIHAWPILQGTTVRQAAGTIHSDLERGFICADIFNCEDLFALSTEAKVKEVGKLRTEGQDYIVKNGDIIHVKFNV